MSKYLKLSRKLNKNSKINKKISIVMILAFFIIILMFSFKDSMNYFIYNGIEKDLSYRMLYVDQNETSDEEKIINDIRKIDHVEDVFSNNYYLFALNLKQINEDNYTNSSFYLMGINEKSVPIIEKGKNIENDDEIICPVNFYPSSNIENLRKITKNNLINSNEIINSTIKVTYNKYDKDFNDYAIEKYLKISGTYKNNPSFIDENVCYASHELIKKMYNDSYENVDFSGIYSSINVLVDNIDNVEYVTKKLESMNYNVGKVVSLNTTIINVINIGSYIISFLVLLVGTILIIFINKNNIIEKGRNIKLLRCLGYSKKTMKKLLFIESFITNILSLLYAIIISFSIYISLKLLIYFNPFIFQKFPINYSFISIIICLFLLIIIVFISNVYLEKILLKRSIISARKD